VYAEDEARLILQAAGQRAMLLEQLVARRCSGEPLEMLLGVTEFAGIRVITQPGVFVPRRRTAGLVGLALAHLTAGDHHVGGPAGPALGSDSAEPLSSGSGPVVVVDLGCGTGAMLAALLPQLRREGTVEAYGLDNDPAAVNCSRRNLEPLGATVLLSDYFAALPSRLLARVDVVLANLPYVPTASIPHMAREARLYEPTNALDGGPDGLVPLRAAVRAAPRWLVPGGAYLCELGTSQVDAARALAVEVGFACDVWADPDDEDEGVLARLTAPISRA